MTLVHGAHIVAVLVLESKALCYYCVGILSDYLLENTVDYAVTAVSPPEARLELKSEDLT